MKFDEILGHDIIKKTLLDQIKNNELVHSYMFVGQEGIGKKIVAKEFARQVLCYSKNNISECENCESCIKFKNGNHPDFYIISPDGNYIKIAQIRQLQENIYKKPILSNKKILIIDDADLMTEEAQNSLLKTLEEPPEYIIIILVLSNESLLLNTIKSRCMKFNFYNLNNKEISDYINKNQLMELASDNILKLCNGSIGKVHKIRENLDLYLKVENLTNEILNGKMNSVIDLLKNSEILYQSKDEISNILEYMIIIIHNQINEEIANNRWISCGYFGIIEIVKKAMIKLKTNTNYDMCIDEMLLNIYDERMDFN